jgi:hypothetical protein
MRCPGCQKELPTPTDPTQRRVRCVVCAKEVDVSVAAAFEGTIDTRPEAACELPPDPLVGTTIGGGDYKIEALLGVGGMGRVYRATQTALGRAVALKTLSPELAHDEQFRRRFDREAGTLASLDHPHIVAVHDMGVENGTPYIVMALVVGPKGAPVTLRNLLDAGPIEEDLCLRVIQQTCAALDYAHKKGVVHRDIKPANILLDAWGNAKIADFGIARASTDSSAAPLTSTGAVLGTLKYMAPEQMADSSKADPRSDLYSLGVVFYELLTGQAPVGRFEMPSETRTGLDHRLDAIVDRALRRAADQRYQTAGQMAKDISRITTEREMKRLDGKEERASAAGTTSPPVPPGLRADGTATTGLPDEPTVPRGAPSAMKRVPRAVWVGGAVLVAGLASIPLWSGGKKEVVTGGDGPTPVVPGPAMGEPAMGGADPSMAEPAMTDPAMGDPAMGSLPSPWATGVAPSPEEGDADAPPPIEDEVRRARIEILDKVTEEEGRLAPHVDSLAGALADTASGKKTDMAGARAAAEAVIAAQVRHDSEAVVSAIPRAVIERMVQKLQTTEVLVRAALRDAYDDAVVTGPRIGTSTPVGPDWALFKIAVNADVKAGGDDEDVPKEAAALAIRENGRWMVYLTW